MQRVFPMSRCKKDSTFSESCRVDGRKYVKILCRGKPTEFTNFLQGYPWCVREYGGG
jgi:hypothetical protein